MPLFFHVTSKVNLESIIRTRIFDCTIPAVRSNKPIATHVCCTTKAQCDYQNFRIKGPIGIIQLNIMPTDFEVIDHARRSSGDLESGVYYKVQGLSARIEYLIPCKDASLLFDQDKIAYIVVDSTTPRRIFASIEFESVQVK